MRRKPVVTLAVGVAIDSACLHPPEVFHALASRSLRNYLPRLVGLRSLLPRRVARDVGRAALIGLEVHEELARHGYHLAQHSSSISPDARTFIGERIKVHYHAGKPLPQAVAIALDEARERGFHVPPKSESFSKREG